MPSVKERIALFEKLSGKSPEDDHLTPFDLAGHSDFMMRGTPDEVAARRDQAMRLGEDLTYGRVTPEDMQFSSDPDMAYLEYKCISKGWDEGTEFDWALQTLVEQHPSIGLALDHESQKTPEPSGFGWARDTGWSHSSLPELSSKDEAGDGWMKENWPHIEAMVNQEARAGNCGEFERLMPIKRRKRM